jgi:putative addiction module killer protein
VLELRYYLATDGRSPFEEWFSGLDAAAGAKVTVAVARLEQGNLSNVKSLGEGVLEYRIDWGPGYRLYFGRDGDVLVILLTGGIKKRQQRDLETAKALWADYKSGASRADDRRRRTHWCPVKSQIDSIGYFLLQYRIWVSLTIMQSESGFFRILSPKEPASMCRATRPGGAAF